VPRVGNNNDNLNTMNAQDPTRIVVPCSLSENLSIEWYNTLVALNWFEWTRRNLPFSNRLNNIFRNCSPTPNEIWIGIVGDDSSMVYYKLSKGIVKPPM
jgi:tRNA-splicing endonuclease subunit Sen15